MTAAVETDWPGKELRPEYRNICRMLVRDQGWRYLRGKNHPVLRPPNVDVGQLSVPCTPSEYRGWQNWLSDLRKLGADLEPKRSERDQLVVPFSDSPAMTTAVQEQAWLSKSEWWARIGGEDWWRHRYGKVPMPASPPAPKPEPARPQPSPTVARILAVKTPPAPEVDVEDKTRDPRYSLREVRAMFRRGYPMAQVVRITGWGAYWIADMAGPDGYCRLEGETG